VEFGLTSSYGSSTTLDPALVLAHAVTLAGLTAVTTYHYRVKSRDGAGNLATSADFTFTTAAAPDTTPPVITAVSAGSVTSSGATVGWATDEPSDSQVEFGLTSSYGSSSTLGPSLVVSHSVTLSGLASGTTYHYRVKSRDAAANLATSSDFTFTTSSGNAGPVPVIVDTDIFSDADDVGALATAFGLQIKGEANVIAIGINTRTSRPAVATNSWKCAAAIAQFYNSASVPIGSDMPDNGTAINTDDFVGPCSQLASPSTPAPDTAVNVFRRALAVQPNGSVVMVEVGYEENLSALLHSSPDSFSPLSGGDLISQKVKVLVIMGGGYPSRSGENNLIGNVTAAQDVASNWPTKIVWSGYEVGDAVHTGNTISRTHPANSPVRVSYEAFVGPNNWIPSYDLTAVYHAIRPGDFLMPEVGPGTNVVNSSGGNVFTLGSGNQYYLTLTDATTLDASIETLLDTLPATLPPDTTPPLISGVAAGWLSPSGATLSWTTDEASDSQADYGLTSSYGSSSALSSSLAVAHSVALSGLATATTYHYRVKSRDAAGNLATSADFTFTTASASAPGPNDTFDNNTIDLTKWTVIQGGSTVACANQELEITHAPGTIWTKGGLQSAQPYDQTGKSVQVQVKRAANNGLGGATYGETSVLIQLDTTHFAEFFLAGGALTAWVNAGSGQVNLTPSWPHYSSTTMQWLRFREAAGILYWEYASGTTAPGTWTVLASTADPFSLTGVKFQIVAGTNVSTTDTAQFDNVSTS
jgi:inosine-uridine nucleoside N-ribohydrolase